MSVPATATAGTPVAVNASGFSIWSPLTATWSWGDGTSAQTGNVTSHVFSKPGAYSIVTTVSDAVGNAITSTHQITVAPAPLSPTATVVSVSTAGPAGNASCPLRGPDEPGLHGNR